MTHAALRQQLVRLLRWEDAHVGFEAAIRDLSPERRGERPEGSPYSAWEILEHLRLAQRDILDFCRNPDYVESKWPDDYWPASPAPPSDKAWEESIAAYLADRDDLCTLALDDGLELTAMIPHGDGQTYLRELLLVADHAGYHVGQLVLLRRLMNAWPPGT